MAQDADVTSTSGGPWWRDRGDDPRGRCLPGQPGLVQSASGFPLLAGSSQASALTSATTQVGNGTR
jgi:hypothetical protein